MSVLTLDAPPKPLEHADPRPHALVIGSGFGGLAAAIRLGARGYRVTVLERLDAPGGRASVFRQDGFTFDAGPTIVTAPFLLEELWALCGRRLADDVELVPMDPFYRIRFDDGTVFDYSGDPARMRAEVARFSPGDVAGYERFMAASEAIYRVGFERLGAVPFTQLDRHGARAAGPAAPGQLAQRARPGRQARARREAAHGAQLPPAAGRRQPVQRQLRLRLIAFLERRWGVHFAMGGTGALVRGMAGLIRGQGGALRCGAEVRRDHRRQTARATGVRAGRRRADRGRHRGVQRGLRLDLPPPAAARAPPPLDRPADRADPVLHEPVRLVFRHRPPLRRRGAPHHAARPALPRAAARHLPRHKLADDFSLYLHRPTATDPSLAPPGCDAFYVLSPVPHLASGTDWACEGERYRRAIAEALEATVLPGCRPASSPPALMTPQDFQDRLLSFRGAAFGMEPLLTQSAWFRPHNRSEEVDGLYLVGAGTHPGAGLPGVLCSAKILDTVVPHAVRR